MKRLQIHVLRHLPYSIVAACFTALILMSCGDAKAGSNRPHLIGGAPSSEALVTKALAAFEARDTVALQQMLVTHQEFESCIYPDLGRHYPAANDKRPEAQQFIWGNQSMSSAKGLAKALRTVGGTQMKLISLRFADGDKKFDGYTLHEGTVATVRLSDGGEAEMWALGSIVEMDGVYKLLTFRNRKD